MLGKTVAQAFPEDRIEEALPRIKAALAGEQSSLEWLGVRSGELFRVDLVPFRETGEAVTHAMLAIRNIEEEKALQHSLEEQSGFLSAVLKQLGERVIVADADGRIVDFGGAPHPGQDRPAPARVGRVLRAHAPRRPALRAARGAAAARAARRRGPRRRDARRHAGRQRWRCWPAAARCVTPDGRKLGAVVVNADLTAFRDAEGRLRRSEERHRRVVESMVDCVFETDEQGRWTHLSENWTAATGHSVEDTLGRPSWEYVHPDDRAAHAHAFAPLLAGERADARYQHRFLTTSGAERWAEVQVRAISGWDGLPTGFVGVMRDITDAMRAQQHAAAERAVMALLSSAARARGHGRRPDPGARLRARLGRRRAVADVRRRAPAPHRAVDRVRRPARSLHGVRRRARLRGRRRLPRPGVDVARAAVEVRRPRRSPSRGEDGLADGICSTVALPLRAAGVPVGVVVMVSRTPREPEPGLVRLLEAIGGHVTQFLQRREAEGRAAEQAEDLRKLSAVAHQLAAQSDHYGARMTLTRAVRDVASASSVMLWEPTATGDELEITASSGAALRGMTASLAVPSGLGTAFETGDFAFAADVITDPRVKFRWNELTSARSGAWVPVVQDGRSVAVLAVSWNTPRAALSERETGLLQLLASEVAITIQRTDLMAQLQSSARTDALTGLPNRRVWDEDLEREIARARRHGGNLCLAMLDLDRFKAFNDHHGHQAGDQLLAATATAWRPVLRTTDTLARYGGEEFAVLLPHSDEEGAMTVVERLLEVVPLGQTASAGVAVWDGKESATELLARADAALYEAKGAGRARALLAS